MSEAEVASRLCDVEKRLRDLEKCTAHDFCQANGLPIIYCVKCGELKPLGDQPKIGFVGAAT